MPDWRDTRAEIEAHYGYDKYPGNCHVIPNHALMIMALLYAPDDFSQGADHRLHLGLGHGLQRRQRRLSDGRDAGPRRHRRRRDWRGPLADRMLISSADGGYAINDAVRVSAAARRSRAASSRACRRSPAPKSGAQFHFSLPGSVQGFAIAGDRAACLSLANIAFEAGRALELRFAGLGAEPAVALTPTFSPPDVARMRTYELMATPLVYPGQTFRARVVADSRNAGDVAV